MDERPFREWRLERKGDEIIFYEGPFTGGVRVSASEAEVYLSGDSGAWSDIIHGRERTEPPRPYWPNLLIRLASMPLQFQFCAILVGIGFVVKASKAATLIDLLLGVAGILLVASGAYGFWSSRPRE
jgi:hypothetical protein